MAERRRGGYPLLVRVLLLCVLSGCTARPNPEAPSPKAERPLAPNARLKAVAWSDNPSLLGISGADRRHDGRLWFAPERTGQLVSADWRGSDGIGPPTALPIEGMPHGLDLEALAFLGPNELLLGTEGRGERDEDLLLRARVEPAKVVVTGTLAFPYRLFRVRALDNRGVEGLCAAGDRVIAASETVVEREGERFAPVLVFGPDSGVVVPIEVKLTSKKGKISALACRAGPSGVEVHAIERHYGVMRLVRFVVPVGRAPASLAAELVVDIAQKLEDTPPNLEGLVWVGENALLAVSDNHYGRKTGPPRAFLIELDPPPTVP